MPQNNPIPIACTSPSRVQAPQVGHLLDAQLYPLGLDTMTQQYFSSPVTPTWHLMNHIHHTVAADTTAGYESIWHDILMVFAITGYAQQLNHRFVVNISQQAWLLQATTEQDEQGFLFNTLDLVNTPIQPLSTQRCLPLCHRPHRHDGRRGCAKHRFLWLPNALPAWRLGGCVARAVAGERNGR